MPVTFLERNMDSISKQKKYLSENLIVESLRMYGSSREDIRSFLQSKYGSKIAEYLINDAWDDDSNNNTRVFLVRDKRTRKIAYYYALNCGILYKDLSDKKMTPIEEKCVTNFIKAMRKIHKDNLSDAERDAANNLLSEAYGAFDEKIENSDRAADLLTYATEQANLKEEREEASKNSGEGAAVKDVLETYPAIDIKFLCRDASYDPGIKLDFKFGVYVFWEIIVPHILRISELVGCKYVYLFAADNSEKKSVESDIERPVQYSKDSGVDPDDEPTSEMGDGESELELKKLVSYYINDLKFYPVSGLSEYTILKPHFERACYTLIQEIAELPQKRELIWSSHDQD